MRCFRFDAVSFKDNEEDDDDAEEEEDEDEGSGRKTNESLPSSSTLSSSSPRLFSLASLIFFAVTLSDDTRASSL